MHEKIRSKNAFILIVLLVMIIFVIGMRIWQSINIRKETSQLPIVAVIPAKQAPKIEKIILPGNVEAWHEAIIYARTNGYIKNWYVDIGNHVKEGQLLAEIETPELNAQLRQARADLNTAIANNELAQTTAIRWRNLLKTDSVSKQETDEKNSAAKAWQAAVIAAQENVNRLQQLVNFERVIAPFDGVITLRTMDIGALINAGSSPGGVALFRISQTNPLYVYVHIPQYYASNIKPKMQVSLSFAEHPGKTWTATLVQTAQAIDPASRTLLAQFMVDNSNEELLPGGYTEVAFTMKVSTHTVRLPVNTLLFRAQGLQVAILEKENRVRLQSIKISRDFGSWVEIASGINPGEKIILNPPDSILNGEKVRVVA